MTAVLPVKNPKMVVRLEQPQSAWLRVEGRRRGLSQGAVVRDLIEQAMKERP